MVRVLTFVGLCAGTYVGVKALDNLVVWMAERREANVDNFRLEREAVKLKHQLLKEIQEKQATAPHEVVEKHHVHSDKDVKLVYKHNAKLPEKHQEDLKKSDKKLVSSKPGNCPGEIVAECLECGETFEIVEPVPHSPL